MEMVKIRFTNEASEDYIIDVAKRMKIAGLRGGFYVVPPAALEFLDQWGCEYEIVERGGYDALVVRPLRSAAAGSI